MAIPAIGPCESDVSNPIQAGHVRVRQIPPENVSKVDWERMLDLPDRQTPPIRFGNENPESGKITEPE